MQNFNYNKNDIYNQPESFYAEPLYSQSEKNEKKGRVRIFKPILAVFLCLLLFAGGGFVGNYLGGSPSSSASRTDNTLSANGESLSATAAPVFSVSDPTGEALTISQVVKKVADSVVEIVTETVINAQRLGQYVQEGAGSGVILSEDGYIVTNNHVIEDATSISVTLRNGRTYKAKLIATDAESDVAVIKIEPEEALTYAPCGDSDKIEVGETAIAIGNPLGSLGGSVTSGIISALDRAIKIDGETMNLLQTTAAVNPGNSGGALFNSEGLLIGIVNAKSAGTGIEGIGFAIPINHALSAVNDLITKGYVGGRPSLNIEILEITSMYTALRYGVSELGVYVYTTDNDLGVKAGDLFISIDGHRIEGEADISAFLKTATVGQTVTVKLDRSGNTVTVEITLTEKVPS